MIKLIRSCRKAESLITEKEYRYWLCNIPGFGAKKIAELLRQFGSAEAVWKSSDVLVAKAMEEASEERCVFRKTDAVQFFEARRSLDHAVESYHKLVKKGIQ